MKRRSYAYAWLVAVIVLATPLVAKAQEPARRSRVELGQNYPNPFNPSTTIPFRINEQLFEGGRRPVVSLRIYNVLAQLVAVPNLQQSGQRLENLELECQNLRDGYCEFWAYWDGFYDNSTREAASGVYIYQLVVNGERTSRRMLVTK